LATEYSKKLEWKLQAFWEGIGQAFMLFIMLDESYLVLPKELLEELKRISPKLKEIIKKFFPFGIVTYDKELKFSIHKRSEKGFGYYKKDILECLTNPRYEFIPECT